MWRHQLLKIIKVSVYVVRPLKPSLLSGWSWSAGTVWKKVSLKTPNLILSFSHLSFCNCGKHTRYKKTVSSGLRYSNKLLFITFQDGFQTFILKNITAVLFWRAGLHLTDQTFRDGLRFVNWAQVRVFDDPGQTRSSNKPSVSRWQFIGPPVAVRTACTAVVSFHLSVICKLNPTDE